jgi:TfoX/Sxy family transcriptional regulator of competence genes
VRLHVGASRDSVIAAMAYDETLADRVREVLAARSDLSERKMFGGVAFMIGGNMAVGVLADDLMVRHDPEEADAILIRPHTRPMDFTGRPMKGMVFVGPEATTADGDLLEWVEAGADFAASLPPK